MSKERVDKHIGQESLESNQSTVGGDTHTVGNEHDEGQDTNSHSRVGWAATNGAIATESGTTRTLARSDGIEAIGIFRTTTIVGGTFIDIATHQRGHVRGCGRTGITHASRQCGGGPRIIATHTTQIARLTCGLRDIAKRANHRRRQCRWWASGRCARVGLLEGHCAMTGACAHGSERAR